MTSIATSSITSAAGQPGGVSLRPCVIVTGASEGIGLALAHRFAAGTRLPIVMIARRPEPLAAAARAVAERNRIEAIPLPLDLTDRDAAERIEAALRERGLHAEILINNAGVGLAGDFAGHEEAAIAALLDLNVRALSLLARRFLPAMIERRRGGIINIASLGGFAPGPYQAAYYASKAYVVSLSRALARETAGTGVHVCVVAPGPVDTQFHARMGADASLYRYLMPAMSADAVARSAWRGWRLGMRVIHPGPLTPLTSMLMRLTPWLLLVPIVGWLLRKRLTRGA